jgi:hypothetical protein
VNFRVRTDAGKFVVTDLNVMGVWLAISERDQFGSYLSAHGGSVAALTDNVRSVTARYHWISAGLDLNRCSLKSSLGWGGSTGVEFHCGQQPLKNPCLALRRDVAGWKGYIQDVEDMREPTIAVEIKKWVGAPRNIA